MEHVPTGKKNWGERRMCSTLCKIPGSTCFDRIGEYITTISKQPSLICPLLVFFPSKRGESIFPFETKNQHHNDETIADQVPSYYECCHFHSVFHEDNNHHGAQDGGDLCSTSLSSPCRTDYKNDKDDNDCSSTATVTSHTYKPSSFLLHRREGIIKASTQRQGLCVAICERGSPVIGICK